MRIVPLNSRRFDTLTLEVGSNLLEEGAPGLSGLVPPSLFGGLLASKAASIPNLKRPLAPPKIPVPKEKNPAVTDPKRMQALLEGLGFEVSSHAGELRAKTSIPGLDIVIKPANGALQAQLVTRDGRVHAELSHLTKPEQLLEFLQSHKIETPKPSQAADTKVRRPLANKPLVDMGF